MTTPCETMASQFKNISSVKTMSITITPAIRQELESLKNSLDKLLNFPVSEDAKPSKKVRRLTSRIRSKVEHLHPWLVLSSLKLPCEVCQCQEAVTRMEKCQHSMCLLCAKDTFAGYGGRCKICSKSSNKALKIVVK